MSQYMQCHVVRKSGHVNMMKCKHDKAAMRYSICDNERACQLLTYAAKSCIKL